MSVMRREAEPDKGLLLDNEYRAQHYPFYKTVDREVFHLGSSECQCLEPMGDHVGGSVKEQPERVGSERATRHSVGAEIFQILDPELHRASLTISAIYRLRLVAAVACDNEADIDTLGCHLDFGYHPLLVFPGFGPVVEAVISADVLAEPFIVPLSTAKLPVNLFHEGRIAGKSGGEAHVQMSPGPVHELMAAN